MALGLLSCEECYFGDVESVFRCHLCCCFVLAWLIKLGVASLYLKSYAMSKGK